MVFSAEPGAAALVAVVVVVVEDAVGLVGFEQLEIDMAMHATIPMTEIKHRLRRRGRSSLVPDSRSAWRTIIAATTA